MILKIILDDLLNFKYNSSITSYFNGSSNLSFTKPFGIEYVRDDESNEFLFVSDRDSNRTIKFDINFKMIKSVVIQRPRSLTSSFKSIFVNSNRTEIIKFDLNLYEQNRLKCKELCKKPSCCELRGIHHIKDLNKSLIVDGKNDGI